MPDSIVPTELGDALRRLAERVDAAPALLGAKEHPASAAVIHFHVRTADVVRVLAVDFGVDWDSHLSFDGVHTGFEVNAGLVTLRVFNIAAPPRSASVSSSQAGLASFRARV